MGGRNKKDWENRNDGKERKCADSRAEEIYCSSKNKKKKKSLDSLSLSLFFLLRHATLHPSCIIDRPSLPF